MSVIEETIDPGDRLVLRTLSANKGRDFWLWFVAGLVFTVFTLIAVLATMASNECMSNESSRGRPTERLMSLTMWSPLGSP